MAAVDSRLTPLRVEEWEIVDWAEVSRMSDEEAMDVAEASHKAENVGEEWEVVDRPEGSGGAEEKYVGK